MKKIEIIFIMFFLVSTSFLPFVHADTKNTSGNTIYVDDDNTDGPWDGTSAHPFQSIQEGINAAKPDDTVFVRNGFYAERRIECRTCVTLLGENQDETIIKGNESLESYFLILSTSIRISNFTFYDYVICESSFNNTQKAEDKSIIIDNNTISSPVGFISADMNSTHGVTLIENNTFVNADNEGFFGIFLIPSYLKTTITHNDISGFEMGIVGSGDLKIHRNTISNCSYYGIGAIPNASFQISITENNFFENTNDVFFGYFINLSLQKEVSFLSKVHLDRVVCNFLNDCSFYGQRNHRRFIKVDHNYWDEKTGFGPKLLLGSFGLTYPCFLRKGYNELIIPWILFDWHPAQDPFDTF